LWGEGNWPDFNVDYPKPQKQGNTTSGYKLKDRKVLGNVPIKKFLVKKWAKSKTTSPILARSETEMGRGNEIRGKKRGEVGNCSFEVLGGKNGGEKGWGTRPRKVSKI